MIAHAQTINVEDIKLPSANVSDNELINRVKDGDNNAYGSIMRRYNQRLFRIARSIVTDDAAAMDIVQEAHIKAYTELDKFQGSSRFITWLASITRNEALMFLRKHKREVSMPDDEMEFLEQNEAENHLSIHLDEQPETFLESKQLKALINQYVDTLPVNFRTVFVLRAIELFSVKETASILELNEETVKTRFFRAKSLLREKIQNYLDSADMTVYEFGGHHCDIIVKNVMAFISKYSDEP